MFDGFSISRREIVRTTVGFAATGIATYFATDISRAQSEIPQFDYLTGIDGGIEDLRGEDEVTVVTGAEGNGGDLAFKPAGIWIDPGTTVMWEATGEGGGHSVKTVDGPAALQNFSLNEDHEPLLEDGDTYEFEFTEEHAGITNYHCGAHSSFGGKGAVAVGDDVPTTEKTNTQTGQSEPNPDDAEAVTDDQSENETTETAPGFGIGSTIAAIGSSVYVLKRSLTDD